jgi:hypothetical protein
MTDTQDLRPAQSGERLPCRGCQVTCPHYQACDGKPWRMAAEAVAAKLCVNGAVND